MAYGKKYRGVAEKIAEKGYTVAEAVAFLKENRIAKFDESVEVHMHLNIRPKKSDEAVRGTIVLPHGTGRTKKVAVITMTKQKEAEDAKADLVGGEELVAEIKSGKAVPGVDFDVIVATPEMMPKLATVAKILGPKGMMPSPKTETVTAKVKETVEMLRLGKKASFKNDDGGNVHQSVGKLSFPVTSLEENIVMFLDVLQKSKPEAVKGRFIRTVSICSTMGPSLSIKL